ncbi:HPP family protein [Zestomonas thermotolerans]|uniref:HPP family protein n=1 Tax=Zestomonas thermotolerans TaxID=157784 RepID=UPI00048544E2|nr:HPP family protein [Pseudomonas thermotolerans]
MTQPRSAFLDWLHAFVPQAITTRPREWLRAGLGASLAMLLCTWLGQQLFGPAVTGHLFGPLAASAVLVFAVSSGALAQPWPLLGSYLVATLVGALLLHFQGGSLPVAGLAVGLALLLMCPLRCLHPPAGGLAFCVTSGGPELAMLGPWVLLPVLFNVLCLLGCALLYNNLTRMRYPRLAAPPVALHNTGDPAPVARVGIQPVDLAQALDELGGFVDLTCEELEHIVRVTEKHALQRSMGGITAGQIMARDLRWVGPETSVEAALQLFEYHHLKALPVLDGERRLVGILSLIDLIGHARQARRGYLFGRRVRRRQVPVAQLMTQPVVWVDSAAHVVELIPLLADQGLHCLPVMERGALVGVITQTDVIAAMQRELVARLA